MVAVEELQRRMERFQQVCRDASIRVTPQRRAVYRELARTTVHPDAETVFERVRRQMPSISLDTVYRTLAFLETSGLIWKVDVLQGRARYDAGSQPHHHLICTRCGAIRDFHCPRRDALGFPPAPESWGRIDRIHVQLRGLCAVCQEKERPKAPGEAGREGRRSE